MAGASASSAATDAARSFFMATPPGPNGPSFNVRPSRPRVNGPACARAPWRRTGKTAFQASGRWTVSSAERYDVVVAGGGAAGVAAAVGAARCGAHTLLLERYGFLGGAATNALVLSYCGFFTAGEPPVRTVGGVG